MPVRNCWLWPCFQSAVADMLPPCQWSSWLATYVANMAYRFIPVVQSLASAYLLVESFMPNQRASSCVAALCRLGTGTDMPLAFD
ncbi:hypothetical protein COO60DRAFT_1611419 [Scenedesmus sp. NREL 46B-D3]|nr:hypothetical protein COO60DRAFT_1611419 [Scenedesmus sp. NREL 46B-D3]